MTTVCDRIYQRACRCCLYLKKGFRPDVVVTAILLPLSGFAFAILWSFLVERSADEAMRNRLGVEVRYRIELANDELDKHKGDPRYALQHLNDDGVGAFVFPQFAQVRMLGLLQMFEAAGGKFPADYNGLRPEASLTDILLKREPSEAQFRRAIEHLKATFSKPD